MDMQRFMEPWGIKRDLIVKAEEESNPDYGRRPDQRPLQDYIKFGIINLDKPPGPSSHEVAAWAKRLLNIQHIGHGGTLDPKVTGILPIALESATKIIQALLLSGKEYICVTRLHSDVSEDRVKAVLNEFIGAIYQRPPIRASVKRRLRIRRIYYLNFLEINGRNLLFRVGCEAGTYIRKLSHDIGETLGCGAHMQELRRTRSGSLIEDSSLVTLHDVSFFYAQYQETKDEKHIHRFIQPMEKALRLYPKIIVRDSSVGAICHGANLAAPGVLALETRIHRNDVVIMYTQKGEAVALAEALASTENTLEKTHGFVAKTRRVLMPRNVYPRKWRIHE
ncbi:MAG: RNA-guided pseudouridylation complex pseudouridine synthase subunit Cbf5 [Candidatus Bathyarchaeota archaeon]|nr:MAG: RNA-guided pseudouridylation complex pseudouridine synthase subunit Cbf5 [Candidatus Bathyarchaeota archaeon]